MFSSGNDLSAEIIKFLDRSGSIYIFSAYIKLETLQALLVNRENVKAIFVRWESKDLILGSSDLEIYPYLKSKGIALYRNTRLHLKAYLDESNNCLLTSANISARALNLPPYPNYNYEIGTLVEGMSFEDRLYFSLIECDSLLITDNIYNQLKEQLPEMEKLFPGQNDFSFKFEAPDKDFLISSLPMSYSPESLIRIYEDKKYDSEIDLNCMLHDLAIYKIPLGLMSDELRVRLSESFFSHIFIKSFLATLDIAGEMYFGTVKEWIHTNCANVPIPRRWEITENIQILYRWIVELGNGKYQVDRPNYSERLFVVRE